MRNLGGRARHHRRRPHPFKPRLKREVTRDDIVRLTEIKIKRISKFDTLRADEEIRALEEQIEECEKNLRNLTRYTIRWFEDLEKNHGKGRERRTEIASFDRVVASKVVQANETLYLNASDGFAGYGLKKDEPVAKCSTLDDIICVTREGVMTISKVQEKAFIGKNPAYLDIFRNATRKSGTR